MIESPLIMEIEAKGQQRMIRAVLEARFDRVPPALVTDLQKVLEETKLIELAKLAGTCKDLKEFRKGLKA